VGVDAGCGAAEAANPADPTKHPVSRIRLIPTLVTSGVDVAIDPDKYVIIINNIIM